MHYRSINMIKVGIIGATGYAGSELINILLNHKDVELTYLGSHSYAGKKLTDIYPFFEKRIDIVLSDDSIENASDACDVVFLALPHSIASKVVTEEILKKCVIIDLGADFRLHSKDVYEKWYKTEHHNEKLLSSAVYALPEIHRESIKGARLIANPGCYTTCSILTLYPLVKNHLIDLDSIVIDAKSGTTGAGRGEKVQNLFCEVNESIKPYGLVTHRHIPEIEQELSIAANEQIVVEFTPHLVPMQRGILATCYAKVKDNVSEEDIKNAYLDAYKDEEFIRLVSYVPETRFVRGSNFIDIYYKYNSRTNRVIAVGAIDNLVKGAAGQAVQNMNIVFGFNEDEGLNRSSGV